MTKQQCINNYLDYLFPLLLCYRGRFVISYTTPFAGRGFEDWIRMWEDEPNSVAILNAFINHLYEIFPPGEIELLGDYCGFLRKCAERCVKKQLSL